MSTTAYYESLKHNMSEGLPRQVYEILLRHVGEEHKITLDQLSKELKTNERQVRDAIETLRSDLHIPICSQSGRPGRWLAKDKAELDECIGEMQARYEHLGEAIKGLRMASLGGAKWQDAPEQIAFRF